MSAPQRSHVIDSLSDLAGGCRSAEITGVTMILAGGFSTPQL
jgi:hypothetical protein